MAATLPYNMFCLLGIVAWGDLDSITIWVNKRGRIVWAPKTWPKKPGSPAQAAHRAAYRHALDCWLAKSHPYRRQWHLAARRASLCMHGLNLYLSATLAPDDSAIRTLERQTNTTLLPL